MKKGVLPQLEHAFLYIRIYTMIKESTNTCLFVTAKGELICLFCRFRVISIRDIHRIRQGEVVSVAEVLGTKEGHIIYRIDRELYYHFHFVLFPLS
jgi:hypothetical protein